MISDAVQMILDRMKSNPEEFFVGGPMTTPWRWLQDTNYTEVLTDEERKALTAGLTETRKKEFHAKALETILRKDRDEDGYQVHSGPLKFSSSNLYVFDTGASGNITPGLQLGNTTVTEKDIKALLALTKEEIKEAK